MLTLQNLCTLGILLLPLVAGYKFNLFSQKAAPQEGDLRLFGSNAPSEGRVEVFHEGRWGTVCDDGWDMAAAQVVCRQLRFPGAKSVVIGKDYGEETGPIWLDDISCNGSENHLFKCSLKDWGRTDCSHKEDVGVICETESSESPMADSRRLLDHSYGLSEDLGKIFDSGIGCDFLISATSVSGNIREDGTTETTVCAHKMILSLFPAFSASADILNLTVEVSPSCHSYFPSFIRYLYTRKIDVTMSSVQCLHWMASRFGMPQLMEGTARLFSRFLPVDGTFNTQVSIYSYARETEDLVLQESCVQYLAWNFENLTTSPAWPELPTELLKAILVRSDLVVPDEYFLLRTLERWIVEGENSTTLETQVDLLNQIRFPMIPVDKLYGLEFNSSLYGTHKALYQDGMIKAFQFNVFSVSKLSSSPKFMVDDDDYRPRLYTSQQWSIVFGASKGQSSSSRALNTPIHFSSIYRDQMIHWDATVFRNQYECSNRGLRCKLLPMTRLYPITNYNYNRNRIIFRNQLLLSCQGRYICQVQDFKENLAYPTNGSLAYPCPDDQMTQLLLVRPEYFSV